MRGLSFHADRDVRVDDVAEPTIEEPTDALVRVRMAGICGSDLHVYNAGAAFGFPPGTRLGHEFIGVVEAVGDEVRSLRSGDAVLSSPSVACRTASTAGRAFSPRASAGRSSAGRRGPGSTAARSGWPIGTRAGAARRRHPGRHARGARGARARCDAAPAGRHDVHRLARPHHRGTAPGQSVAVIGDGAVGLSAVHGAVAKGAEAVICLGHHEDRLAVARRLGATHVVISREPEEIREQVMEATGGEGAHVVVDTISGIESMAAAHSCVRAGGTISCLGMDHFMGRTPTVNWFDQFLRNISITGGLVPGSRYLPELLDLVAAGRLEPSPVLTHRPPLDEAAEGYRLMADRVEGVVKVAVLPE